MNYYNPYFYGLPTSIANSAPKVGLLTRLFGRSGATFSSILNGTQKVLNVANQAIPLVKQAKPMFTNAKTMFKIMNEFKKGDLPKKSSNKQINNKEIAHNNNYQNTNSNTYDNKVNNPVFFA